MRTRLRLILVGFPVFLVLVVALSVETATGQPADFADTPLPMTLDELEDEIERREEDLQRYGKRLESLEQRNREVRQQLEAREAELERQEHQVRRRVVTLCRLSRGGYIQLLRGANTWAEIVRRAQLARAVIDQDVGALTTHQEQVAELARARQSLSDRLEAQRVLSQRIVRYRRELQEERQRRFAARNTNALPQSLPIGAPDDDLDLGLPPLEL